MDMMSRPYEKAGISQFIVYYWEKLVVVGGFKILEEVTIVPDGSCRTRVVCCSSGSLNWAGARALPAAHSHGLPQNTLILFKAGPLKSFPHLHSFARPHRILRPRYVVAATVT